MYLNPYMHRYVYIYTCIYADIFNIHIHTYIFFFKTKGVALQVPGF